MPPLKLTRARQTPAQRAERCATHKRMTSPTDAEAFRLLAELIHGLEDLTTLVETLVQGQAVLQAQADVTAKLLADIQARIG